MGLLRRINQNGTSGTPSQNPNTPASVPPQEASRLDSLRERRVQVPTTAQTGAKDGLVDIKSRVQTKLLSELDPSMDTRSPEVRSTIEELFTTILNEESIVLSRNEKSKLFDQIIAEILGFGPLESLLADDTITEIMVNGPRNIYIEQKGRLSRSNVTFENDDHVLRVLDRQRLLRELADCDGWAA